MAGEDIKNSHRGGQSIKYTKRQSSVKNSFVTKTIQFVEISYVLFFGLRKKNLKTLAYITHFLYLRTSALALPPHNHIPIKANSLEATFAKCWTYYSSRAIFSKSLNTLHSIISISLANKLEWLLMTEWDRLYLSFLKILLASLAYVHFL